MLFTLRSIDAQGEIRYFSLQLARFEYGLDFISRLAGRGEQLLNVELVEGSKSTPLPIALFDGELFSDALSDLERQWQTQLNKPVCYHSLISSRVSRRLDRYRSTISRLEKSVELGQQQLLRFRKTTQRKWVHTNTVLILEGTLDRFKHNLAVEQASLRLYTACVFKVTRPS